MGGATQAAAAAAASDAEVSAVADVLCDAAGSIGERYRAVFTLMNVGGDAAVDGLVRGLRSPGSALLRHEIAYVLGQMGNARAVAALGAVLADAQDDRMVRHEAGEALGAVADDSALPLLREFVADALPEV